jgi:hypothetical protein
MRAEPVAALSADSARRRRFRTFVAIAIVACLTTLALSHLVFREFVDDAYGYLRYCINWDAGLGLVYNPGERVIAFASYLFVVLIAAIHKLSVGIPPTSVVEIVNMLMSAASCAIMWRFLDPTRLLYWAAVIFVYFYFLFIDATMNGMETAPFLPVIAGTLLALRNGRFEAAIPLTVVAAITRRPKNLLLLSPVRRRAGSTVVAGFGRLPREP